MQSCRSWSSKVAPDHHTTTMFECWYDVPFIKCCVCFMWDLTGPKSSTKIDFCLVSPQSTFPKLSGMFYWQILDEPLCSFWLALVFAIGFFPWMPFLPTLSFLNCWIIMNSHFTWGKWGLQFFRTCSGSFCDLLNDSSMCSWRFFGMVA